ncbi:MAG: ATP-binding protein [Candidatus Bathyarchaeum sp.]|nr:MAG: ATP-binding protein [Candidatus Bathyarchaeum sp.]
MELAIKTVNLTKYYGKLLAVDHINFEVKKGEIFGFLGPNGAGKTTTTRMLIGISKPSEGTAEVMGYNIQKQSVEAKELMGIVPDISNVYTDLTAWDNLTFTGRLYDIPKAERNRRAEELLELFGLFDRRYESVEGFSRGMKRKLCIAMALMNKSSILFLDEPTSGLDVQSVLTIRNLVKKLNADGLTIFLTTHNMEEANQMCDRVAIINKGKIAAIDTPENLKRTIKKLQAIEISFVNSTTNLIPELKTLQGVTEVVKNGDKYHLSTDNPPKTLSEIWRYASVNNLELNTVNTLGPSLEDVFVSLTGITSETKSNNKGNSRSGNN